MTFWWILKLGLGLFLSLRLISADNTRSRRLGVLVWDNASSWSDDGTAQIPLGNGGDVTAGVWISNTTSDLRVLVGSSSAFDENKQPVRHGAIRISLDPPLLTAQQIFDPFSASVIIESSFYLILVFVDANDPLLRVSIESKTGETFSAVAALEPYRQFAKSKLGFQMCGPTYDHYDTILNAKDLPKTLRNAVTWYHENPGNATLFEETMRKQGVDPKTLNLTDPFRGRIFGGSIYGLHMGRSLVDDTMISGNDLHFTKIQVALSTEHPSTPDAWKNKMASVVASNPLDEHSKAWRKHIDTWNNLWKRSYVTLSIREGDDQDNIIAMINSHIVWDRYLTLIQGRDSKAPIKFNGQAFTANHTGNGWDYRQWGADYWWQNTRQPYYNSLMQGDVDVLNSLLDFYRKMLPYCQARTFAQFKDTDQPLPNDACFYPETTTMFGTYAMYAWGCEGPISRPYGASESPWIRFHWTGALELALLILDRFEWTGDKEALVQYLPIAKSVLSAFMSRFPILDTNNGIVDMFPSQSLETWQCNDPGNRSDCVTNPAPDIAGLKVVLGKAISLPREVISKDQRKHWEAYLKALPDLPTKIDENDPSNYILLPGERLPSKPINSENTELYAVHPFRIFGAGKDDFQLAQHTYEKRRFPCNEGWCQDIVDAAMLNFTNDLVQQLKERVTLGSAKNFRFPGFAERFQDYEPSLDHFSTLRTAVNYMLLSPLDDNTGRMILFPGFPSDVWNVEFKLHGPNQTVVEASCTKGEVTHLHVTPPEQAWRVHSTGNCRSTLNSYSMSSQVD